MLKLKFLLLIIFIGNNIIAQNRIQFAPIKDSSNDTILNKFIDTLKAVVKRKDAKKILTLLDKNIQNGFEVKIDGIHNFKKIWELNKRDDLWKVLSKLLFYGGQYATADEDAKQKNKTFFVYPYFFDGKIENQQNYFELYVVDGVNINMRSNASIDSKIINTFSYEVVKEIDSIGVQKYKNGWVLVKTLDDKYQGYIKNDLLYNFADYRMFITKRKSIWKISILVSGD